MDPNTSRDGSWPPEQPSYWRRRVFALCGAVGILGLVTWACSAATGGLRTPERPAAAATSASARPTAIAGAAARPVAAVTVTARPGPATRAASPAHSPGGVCSPRAVVISLSVSRQAYQQPARPRFTIYAVSTYSGACRFDAGPRSLRLVINSGPVHSWSPADCARGRQPDMVRLSRGVPFVEQISWNRERSVPGCSLPRAVALPGTYTATASYRTDHSQTAVFVLR